MLETVLVWLGYGLCHQLPERSFFAGGVQVPVCARDTGIYIGFSVALILIAILDKGRRSSELPRWPATVVLGLLIGAMAFDGITSYSGMRVTSNEIRLITGLGTGFALAAFIVPLLNSQLWIRLGSGRLFDETREFLFFLAGIPVVYALVMWPLPLLGPLYPFLTGVAIIATFTAVNLVIVCMLPPFERRAERLSDARIAVLVALGFTLVELSLSAYLKLQLLSLAGFS